MSYCLLTGRSDQPPPGFSHHSGSCREQKVSPQPLFSRLSDNFACSPLDSQLSPTQRPAPIRYSFDLLLHFHSSFFPVALSPPASPLQLGSDRVWMTDVPAEPRVPAASPANTPQEKKGNANVHRAQERHRSARVCFTCN